MTNPEPGWYHGEGDPPDTVRWWDGSTWTTDPLPPPPGWRNPVVASVEYGTAWRRFGAAWIDGLIALLPEVPVLWTYLGDVFDDIEAGGDGTTVAIPTSTYLIGITVGIVFMAMVAFWGTTPGKRMLGLRITLEDSTTSPPGLARAFRRAIPGFLGVIPVIGPAVGFLVPFASFFMVMSDDENQSVYDRIGGTRVIRVR